MANEDLPNIVEAIFTEEQPEREDDVNDAEEFCSMVADWILKLDAAASNEGVVASRSRAIISQAMERDAISEILSEGLERDPDSDQLSLYVEAFGELREMAEEMHTALPRTYPMPVASASVGMRA